MRLRIAAVVIAIGALVLATAWIMAWPLEKAVYLAPVIVIAAAAVAGLLILWGKVAWQQLQESKNPRLVAGLWLAGFALLALLTVLGVKLPRE